MKIRVNLNKPSKASGSDYRTNVYVWKNLDHLKAFYAGIVEPRQIDGIVRRILTAETRTSGKNFRRREDLNDVLNESCLCNMVEISLLDNSDVMNTFLAKPVEFMA